VAILRYLVREFPEVADHWYPKDSRAVARIDEFMAWQHTALRMPCSKYILSLLKPEIFGGTPPAAIDFANYKQLMEKALDQVENMWLEGSDFIHGDQISIADLLCVGEIEMTSKLKINSLFFKD